MKKSDLISLVREVVQVTEKKKGVDGKACWKGYRYAGTKNGKDICIKVKGVEEETEADSKITLISVIDGKRNLNIEHLRQIFNGDVLGTFYIRTYEEDEYENEKPISKQEALEYIKYYNSRIDGDSNTEERLGAKLGVLGIESELRFNHGEVKADPTVFSTNENYADGKEKEIVDDILSSLNEGSLDSVLNKMKQYAKKGLLTLAMVASVAQGLQAQGVDKNQADQIQQSGIELVQQTSKINKQVEKQNLDKVKKLLGGSFEKMNKLAQQTGTILVANKGTNLNLLKNMNQMNAKSHFNGSIEKASLQDQKVFKAKDGKYIVISFYQITVNENYADGKVKGKSRPGRVKKSGASCKGSVTDLRAKAKKYGGEKGKMYHWCANMKGGKK